MSENQCPWDAFRPGTLRFCEEHLCSWIVAPAETWSNLSYFMIGAWLLLRARDHESSRRIIGWIALVVGSFSGLYHASHLWVTETFDLGSMGFLSSYLLCHALARLGWLRPERFWHLYWFLSSVSWVALLFVDGPPRLWIFASMIFLFVNIEGFLAIRSRRLKERVDHSFLLASLGFFLAAYAFWLADFYRWYCVPGNHFFSGHAAWHLINAFCFLTLARYLDQFRSPWLAEKGVDRYA